MNMEYNLILKKNNAIEPIKGDYSSTANMTKEEIEEQTLDALTAAFSIDFDDDDIEKEMSDIILSQNQLPKL